MAPALIAIALSGLAAGPGAGLVLSGRIERIAAGAGAVAALRGGEVRVLSEDGRLLLRLGPLAGGGPDGRAGERREEILDRLDVPESERDFAEADDLVDDERRLRERRGAGTAPSVEAPPRAQLAGSEDELWVAAHGFFLRVDGAGRARRTPGGLRAELLASAGGLLAAVGGRIWRSDDGGATWTPIAETGGSVSALAATEDRIAWATGHRVGWKAGPEVHGWELGAPVVDLRFCGKRLLALIEGGAVAVARGAGFELLRLPGPAKRLACGGRRPDVWIAAGPRLYFSEDGGRGWAERTDGPPAELLDAAVGRDCLWAATAVGLFCLPIARPADPPLRPGWTAEPRRPETRWETLLPRLVVVASARRTNGRHDLRALTYADFPLGRPALPAVRSVSADEPAVAPPLAPADLGADAEAPCLAQARREAVARAQAEPERARSYVQRARRAAWLPELRLLVDRRLGRDESLDLPRGGSTAVPPLGLDTSDDVRYEARATWDLSKLVFSAEELAAEAQALRMADMRREIESLTNRLYFERRRVKMEPLSGPAEPAAQIRRALRLQELEAELDALSGGAFGRCTAALPRQVSP